MRGAQDRGIERLEKDGHGVAKKNLKKISGPRDEDAETLWQSGEQE
jgi:hypothetical protein